MRDLLQKVVGEIERFPADQQDVIAERILAELVDERAWAESFAATTDEQWKKLESFAREEINSGESIPLEQFLDSESEH